MQVKPSGGFAYSSAAENNLNVPLTGEVATYDGSGFVRDLSGTNRTAFIESIGLLKSNLWVDKQVEAT